MNPRLRRKYQQYNAAQRRSHLQNYEELLRTLCCVHASKESAKVLELLQSSDRTALIDYADSLSEQSYSDAASHFAANQLASMIRKYPSFSSSYDPRGRALEKFKAAEATCAVTNARVLSWYSSSPLESSWARARDFIRYVLSDAPQLEEIYSLCAFGPGASIGVNGNATNLYRKLSTRAGTVTPGALHYANAAITSHAQLRELFSEHKHESFYSVEPVKAPVSVVSHNKITFVPKTAKIHRTIAVEPLWNGFLEKGIDLVMRKRLTRVGINLRDQTLNQAMAREGSLDEGDSFVTIDLSAASDSIATELVRYLLPPEWFALLNTIRAHNYELDADIYPYQKFCSMGNGFCFPLETLLFASLCHAVGCGKPGTDFMVYGDDIIVRRSKYESLVDLLDQAGFQLNVSKTFSHGPFRESCGGDYFNGKDVRPVTLDFDLDSLEAWFKLLNASQRNDFTKAFFEPLRPYILGKIPEAFRYFRPHKGPEDTGIDAVERDEYLTSSHVHWNRNLQCWAWRELLHRPIPDRIGKCDRFPIILVTAALSGSDSAAPFVVRRKTRTTVAIVSHGGSAETRDPPPWYSTGAVSAKIWYL